jgi:hypothetical protein
VPISAHPDAGHQIAPSVVVDDYQAVHVVWQDQRYRTDGERAASPANADVLACEIGDDGRCMYEPDRLSLPSRQGEIGNRPQVTTDGERIIAVWSTYAGTTDEELTSATQISWAARGLDFGPGWSAAQPAVLPEGTAIGGRLVDVASDPTGGVVLVYGRRTEYTQTFFTRLAAGSNAWDAPILLGDGIRGAFPSVAVGPDGTSYVVYNRGSAQAVTVVGQQIAPGATTATRETEISTAQFGRKGQPVVDVTSSGEVWVMYVFEPVLSGELNADQVPNEIRVERGVAFFTDPAPASQLVTPQPGDQQSTNPGTTPTPTTHSATATRAAHIATATAVSGGSPYAAPSDYEIANFLYNQVPIILFKANQPQIIRFVDMSPHFSIISELEMESAWEIGGLLSFVGNPGIRVQPLASGGWVSVDVFASNSQASQVLSSYANLPRAERFDNDATASFQEIILFSTMEMGEYVSWAVMRDRNYLVMIAVVAQPGIEYFADQLIRDMAFES